MKTAIYVRVSTDKQEELNQLPECMELAAELGLSDLEIIQEKMSAYKNPERESILGLLKADHVIIWSYDRLHRNRAKFMELMQYARQKGVKIHSVRERWLEELYKIPAPWDTILTDFLLQVIGWMAEEESSKRSDRVRIAFERDKKDPDSNKWGRPEKDIDATRLEACMSAGSLRKIADAYNQGLTKKDWISYTTVKKLTQKTHEGKAQENPCEERRALIDKEVV